MRTNPADATGVDRDRNIAAFFSQDMKATSVNGNTVDRVTSSR